MQVHLFLPDLFDGNVPQVHPLAEAVLVARMRGAGDAARGEGEAARLHGRMAVNLKGPGRSASGRHLGAFEEAGGGVQVDGPHVLEVRGRRQDQGAPGPVGVVPAGNDGQVAPEAVFQPAFAVHHPGQLSQCHTMDHGDGQAADTGFVLHVQDGPVHVKPVGIRAVQDHDLFAIDRTGIQQMLHGNIIGIVPQAYVLDIHHQHIKFPHAFLAGHIGTFVIE